MPDERKPVICPWCGFEMAAYTISIQGYSGEKTCFYECAQCCARSPMAITNKDAYDAAIRSSIPHVLTLDEARMLEPHTAIYAEIKGGRVISQCGMMMELLSTNPASVMKLTEGWKRYWTQYPSRELRAATPWKEEN